MTDAEAATRYGATEEEWTHFDLMLGLTSDLLPVVSRPGVPIAPYSTVEELGKVPTEYNRHGQVHGLSAWTKRSSTPADIARWSRQADYGICVQTRTARALDVDITDASLAVQVQAFIASHVGPLPCRFRRNSPKFLLPFLLPGELKKQTIPLGNSGKIEFLATGEQFIAIGTHPSGARYEWRDGLPEELPELPLKEFEALWSALRDEFAVAKAKPERATGKGDVDDLDRLHAIARFSAETLEHLVSALGVNDATGAPWIDPSEHEPWIAVGQNAASLKGTEWEDRMREAWLAWSALAADKYEDGRKDPQATWDSFTADESDYRGIFTKAEAGGWSNPWRREAPKTDDEYARLTDRSDAGNANLLIELTAGDFRWVPERQAWLCWDGAGWHVDRYGAAAKTQALRVALWYQRKASELAKQARDGALDDKERKRLMANVDSLNKWAVHCRNKRSIDAMLALAARDERMQLPAAALDRHPWLLGVGNGVVDLETGQLRPAAREDYVTKRAPFAYDPAAGAPRWETFISEVTGLPGAARGEYTQRPHLATYLQRALGYSITASTAEHKMFLAIGSGANGKNVLLDIFQEVAGDYCQSIPPEALAATRHDADAERPTPTAATLAGARAAVSSESKDGQRLDVALVKRHTGGGFMTARLMRENTFRFEITHKLWLMTNHRPALDHLDDAIRGRLHLLPFDRKWNRPGHPEPDRALPDGDKDLMTKLRAEAAGILAWLVQGAVAYRREGLEPPAEVVRMTRDFFKEQDPMGRWLEHYELCDAPESGSKAADLFGQFCAWLIEDGETSAASKSMKAFAAALETHHVRGKKTKEAKFYALRPLQRVTGDGS